MSFTNNLDNQIDSGKRIRDSLYNNRRILRKRHRQCEAIHSEETVFILRLLNRLSC